MNSLDLFPSLTNEMRDRRESFVTGHIGGNRFEILGIMLVVPVSIFQIVLFTLAVVFSLKSTLVNIHDNI